MVEVSQFCTFHLHDLLFGVEVSRVQEVLRLQDMTRIPLAPPEIRGLINLRGQIVTAIDLRSRLSLEPFDDGASPTNVVLRTEGGGVSLLVDEIGDVVEVGQEVFEPPPESLRGVAREMISGVYKLQEELLLILDVDRAVHTSSSDGRRSDEEEA